MSEADRAQKDLDALIEQIRHARTEAKELSQKVRAANRELASLKVALSTLERTLMEILK